MNLEDKQILNLIEIAVVDSARKELYIEALPKMTGEEKLKFTIKLWEMWMVQLDKRVKDEMEIMIEEMATNDDVEYSPADFQQVSERVLNEVLAEKVEVEDEDQLKVIREELGQIHELVLAHEDELEKIKDKLD